MDTNSAPIKPLVASTAPTQSPARVYFFERPDGSRIHVNEESAWNLFSRPQQTLWGPVRYKYLGTSDGKQYAQAVAESHLIFREHGLEAAQEHLRQALETEAKTALQDKTPPRNFDTVGSNGLPIDRSRL